MTDNSSESWLHVMLQTAPKKHQMVIRACIISVLLLAFGQPALANDENYSAARAHFLDDLAYAQTRGIGISNYKTLLQPIDQQEQTTGDIGSLTRLISLRSKLQEQLTEIDREGFGCLGSEIQGKLWRALKENPKYWGACIDFHVNQDGIFSHFKWIQHSASPKMDQDILQAFAHIVLNKRSPNQVELPLTGRFSPGLYSYLTIFDPSTGRRRYAALSKFPCNMTLRPEN